MKTAILQFLGSGGKRHLPMPVGMRCEVERLFISRATLDAAPRLRGPHIVFTTPNLAHYTHWLINNLLPLYILLPYAPPGTRIVLPATLRIFRNPTRICDHHDILRAIGFDGLPFIEVETPACHIDDVIWLDQGFIETMPASAVQAFRTSIVRRLAPQMRHNKRLYIARRGTRRVANAARLESFLIRRGFTIHMLDDATFDQ